MGLWDRVFGRSKSTSYSQEQDSNTKQSSRTQVHPLMRRLGRDLMGRADEIAGTPFMPNRGLRVAAFQPGQTNAMDMSNQMLQSMGFNPVDYLANMPDTETMGGMEGYTTGKLFDDAMDATDPEGVYANLMTKEILDEDKKKRKRRPAPAAANGVADPAALAEYYALKGDIRSTSGYSNDGYTGNQRSMLDSLYDKAYGRS